MRAFGILVGKLGSFHEPKVPDSRVFRANPPEILLLDEAVKGAFDQACLNGELDIAGDLLALLEKRNAARPKDGAAPRPDFGALVRRMRGELERRHVMQGTRPPENLWRELPGD